MLIYVFVPNYPCLFKPYYDSQFSDLIRQGHDVRVFSAANIDATVNEKVTEWGLDRRTRHYFVEDLRQLPRHAGAIAASAMDSPLRRLRAARHIWRIPGASLRQRLRHIVRMLTLPSREPDLCLIHGMRTRRLFTWIRAFYPRTRLAVFYHGGGLAGGGAAEVFGDADAVFTNTDYSIGRARELECSPGKLVKLPVGFDTSEYQPPRPRSYRPSGTLRLVSASRLSPEKGHEVALRALGLLRNEGFRDFVYTIFGTGFDDFRRELRDLVASLDLHEHVRFAGAPPTRAVIEALGEADAVLLTSVPHRGVIEMQAAIVQEAALMEAIVVTSRMGGVPESTPPEYAQFSAECGDVEGTAAAIRRLADLPVAELARLGREAREWVLERYDIQSLNRRMLASALGSPADETPTPTHQTIPA
jgi:colanic acid/amylovoran biosynthesis glycosyltransferase